MCKIDDMKVNNYIIDDIDICKICDIEKLTIQNTSAQYYVKIVDLQKQ